MRGIANPIFIIPIMGGLYLYVLLKMGGFWLPGGRVITKAEHPRSYWLLMGLTLCAVAVVTGYAVWEALPPAVVHGH